MLDAVEYKNGQKNHWRRFVWNRLESRVRNKREAMVLYLPGENDCDRPEALRRGFRPANLIAIERDREVAKKLKANASTVIEADLLSVLRNWRNPNAAIVIADLQCGLTWDGACLILKAWMSNKSFANGSLLINVQRGREQPDDEGWKFLRGLKLAGHNGETIRESFCRKHGTDLNSRAPLLFGAVLSQGIGMALMVAEAVGCKDDATIRRTVASTADWFQYDWPPPYRSSRVVMDSLIIHDTGLKPRVHELPEDMADAQVRRKIAAAMAWRTMRLKAA